MREALARTDFDFSVSETGRGARTDRRTTRLPRMLRTASVATTGLVSVAILLNALFMQDRKHAAPLLRVPEASAPAEAPAAAAPVRSAPAATPARAEASVKAGGRDAIADEISRFGGERKTAKPVLPTDLEKGGDPIASLLGAGTDPSINILGTQKALLRLGYVLRSDGVAGMSTRQAITQYERDNKLPVHGDLTPKLARDIAARAARLGH